MLIPGTEFRAAARSVCGRRVANEDATLLVASRARSGGAVVCAAVADGMGGEQAGVKASRLAVESLAASVRKRAKRTNDWRELAESGVLRAHRDVRKRLARRHPGGGTTLSALLLVPDAGAFIAHVGDSRVYRIRDGEIRCLTTDHNLAAEMAAAGESSEAEVPNAVTRAVGQEHELKVDVEPDGAGLELRPGDLFVLTSDGVTGTVLRPLLSDEQIRDLVLGAETVEIGAEALVREAYANGTSDNVSVVLVECGRHARSESLALPPPLPPKATQRLPARKLRAHRATTYALLSAILLVLVGLGLLVVVATRGNSNSTDVSTPGGATPRISDPHSPEQPVNDSVGDAIDAIEGNR